MDSNDFIQQICQRPLPINPMTRIRILAKELAEGAAAEAWDSKFATSKLKTLVNPEEKDIFVPDEEALRQYILQRWGDYRNPPNFDLLVVNGYLQVEPQTIRSKRFSITQEAFGLIEEVEPATILVSYKRSESSAFALLIKTQLEKAGLQPFLDIEGIEPGDIWRAQIQVGIEERDYFVVLLGMETLKSEWVINEIKWALGAKKIIIPIEHNGFKYKGELQATSEGAIHTLLDSTQAIRVKEENPSEYDKGINQLLNRFGISL